eukprot:CAMPEP_0174702774 /NCGR_PEP_ID=MMETSP1094-20130205/6949_1 /TAXON_ID=156173 /ORGANISM="Chrysochromulina brevifilum, Strain UTEX LB 985" /LENGTH=167 /DNA_ID=CAMNT_0015900595 /DNA_START=111 /DNA_END=615 /DNA_ORIENTATION=-
MSKSKLPFAEAKSCRDVACMFCPCGALRLALNPPPLALGRGRRGGARMLVVNEIEVMLLHLAESKYAWEHPPSSLALPPYERGQAAGECIEVRGLGRINASCGETCTSRAPIFTEFGVSGAVRRATGLTRHRVQSKWAGHIKYATVESEVRLKVSSAEAGVNPSDDE